MVEEQKAAPSNPPSSTGGAEAAIRTPEAPIVESLQIPPLPNRDGVPNPLQGEDGERKESHVKSKKHEEIRLPATQPIQKGKMQANCIEEEIEDLTDEPLQQAVRQGQHGDGIELVEMKNKPEKDGMAGINCK